MIALALPDLATAFSADLVHRGGAGGARAGMAVLIEETAAEPQREYDPRLPGPRAPDRRVGPQPDPLKDSIVVHDDLVPPVVLIGEVEQH